MRTWDRELTVGLKHLKSFGYVLAECQQMQHICDACGGLRLRINRVYSGGLEESVQRFLESLGKLNRA